MLEPGFVLAHVVTVIMKVTKNDILPVILISTLIPVLAKVVGDFLKERVVSLRKIEGSGSEHQRGKVEIELSSGEKIIIDLNRKMSHEETDKAVQLLQELAREPDSTSPPTS